VSGPDILEGEERSISVDMSADSVWTKYLLLVNRFSHFEVYKNIIEDSLYLQEKTWTDSAKKEC
jgi:hypothetical protein